MKNANSKMPHRETIGARSWNAKLGKLCSPTTIGPMPYRAQLCAVDELPTSLNLVESDKHQTLRGRVWIKFRLSVGKILTLV